MATRKSTGWKPASKTPATAPRGFRGDWGSLTPGMRREIARQIAKGNPVAKKKAKPAGKKKVSEKKKTPAKKRRNPAIVLSPAETSLIRKISHLSSQPATVARAKQLKALRARWKAVIGKKNPGRATPSVAKAKALVQRFVGRASGKETAMRHPGLKKGTVLGNMKARLDYLLVANPNIQPESRHGVRGGAIDWRASERPHIMAAPSGKRYHFLGGNQDLSKVAPLRKANGKPGMVDLGEVLQLGYTARKHVDNYRLQPYYHNLGEENGKRPHLCYDAKRKQMYLSGGNYRTEAEGMAN